MQVTPALIRKYHQGRCAPEEKTAVEAWLNEAAWPEAFDNAAKGEEALPGYWTPPARSRRWVSYGLAASVLLLVLAGAAFFLREQKQEDFVSGSPAILQEVVTQNGETRQLTLEDGTMVYLNAATTFQIPGHFSDTLRQVMLTGEAYFEVAKDANRPFVIRTAKTKTRVLGTRFNLKAYEDGQTELVVAEGKVAFSSLSLPGTEKVLVANERAVHNDKTGIRKDRVYAARYLAWKDNRLILDDLPLSGIAPLIERRYGVKVVIKEVSLNSRRYSGSFDNPELERLVEDIAFVTGLKYAIKDSTVILTK